MKITNSCWHKIYLPPEYFRDQLQCISTDKQEHFTANQKVFFFFTLQCKQMYFQSRKLTNIIILFWREIHSFVSKNVATKHPCALICVYNRIGRTHFGNCQRQRNDCSQYWQPVCAIYFSRDQSSDKLINFPDSQLDTRDSILETQDSILETIEDRVSSLEDRGSRDCQLTFERHCN